MAKIFELFNRFEEFRASLPISPVQPADQKETDALPGDVPGLTLTEQRIIIAYCDYYNACLLDQLKELGLIDTGKFSTFPSQVSYDETGLPEKITGIFTIKEPNDCDTVILHFEKLGFEVTNKVTDDGEEIKITWNLAPTQTEAQNSSPTA